MVHQFFNLEGVLETLSSRSVKGNFERRSHIVTFVYLSPLTAFLRDIPNSSHAIQLYIFEDNAVVIQMINKGRSPNRWHVTRTHRIDLDWLF